MTTSTRRSTQYFTQEVVFAQGFTVLLDAAFEIGSGSAVDTADSASSVGVAWNGLIVPDSAHSVAVGKHTDNTGDYTELIESGVRRNGASSKLNLLLQPHGDAANRGALVTLNADDNGSTLNARGNAAIDLQMSKSAVNQVASGANSVIVGGASSRASGERSVVIGGLSCVATAQDAIVIGGASSNAGHAGAIVLGQCVSEHNYSLSYCGKSFLTTGYAKYEVMTLAGLTAGAASVTLTSDGAGSGEFTIGGVTGAVYVADIQVVALDAAGAKAASWQFDGVCVTQFSGSVAIQGTPASVSRGTNAGAPPAGVSCALSIAADALRITGTGATGLNLLWFATIRATKIGS